jgi:hypothetical protein
MPAGNHEASCRHVYNIKKLTDYNGIISVIINNLNKSIIGK